MEISSEHPIVTLEKQTIKLCRPLFSVTPVTYFDYESYSFDGYFSGLGTNGEFFRTVYHNKLLPTLPELTENTLHYVFLSPLLLQTDNPLQTNKISGLIHFGSEFDVCHRLCLLFNSPRFVEIFTFGLPSSSKNPIVNFINQITIFEKFCVYFREVSRNLIQQVEHAKVVYDNDTEPSVFGDLDFKNTHAYTDFLCEIKLKKYNMLGNRGKCVLSAREFECLVWLMKNKTAKQIGRILSLSPRTVEEYLLSAKNKLGCQSKFELIELAYKNPIIKIFAE